MRRAACAIMLCVTGCTTTPDLVYGASSSSGGTDATTEEDAGRDAPVSADAADGGGIGSDAGLDSAPSDGAVAADAPADVFDAGFNTCPAVAPAGYKCCPAPYTNTPCTGPCTQQLCQDCAGGAGCGVGKYCCTKGGGTPGACTALGQGC